MSFPIRLERDTTIIDWRAYEGGFSTLEATKTSTTQYVVSDGLLHADFATVTCNGTPTIAANKQKAIGINLQAPLAGTDYTPYQISVVAVCDDINCQPVLFVGESIATITSLAAGDLITDVRLLATCEAYGPEGASMNRDMIILAKQNTADRGICFGIGFAAGASAATTVSLQARMSVRRMIGIAPPVIDTTKM